MSTEKMREQFLEWWWSDDQRELRCSCAEGWARHVWYSSRAAIEVELPPIGDYIDRYGQGNNCDEYVDMVKDAIESLGLKVKPC